MKRVFLLGTVGLVLVGIAACATQKPKPVTNKPPVMVGSPTPTPSPTPVAQSTPAVGPVSTAPSGPAPVQHGDLPYAKPVPGKPGYVYSPFAPDSYVDVKGFPPGTEVKCPYSGKTFLVP